MAKFAADGVRGLSGRAIRDAIVGDSGFQSELAKWRRRWRVPTDAKGGEERHGALVDRARRDAITFIGRVRRVRRPRTIVAVLQTTPAYKEELVRMVPGLPSSMHDWLVMYAFTGRDNGHLRYEPDPSEPVITPGVLTEYGQERTRIDFPKDMAGGNAAMVKAARPLLRALRGTSKQGGAKTKHDRELIRRAMQKADRTFGAPVGCKEWDARARTTYMTLSGLSEDDVPVGTFEAYVRQELADVPLQKRARTIRAAK